MGVNLLMVYKAMITPHMHLVEGMVTGIPLGTGVSVRLVQVRVLE